MADNTKVLDPVETSTITAGDTIATDEIAPTSTSVAKGAKVQRIKAGFGADGEYADVTSTVPLPVVDAKLQPIETISLLRELIMQNKITHLYLSAIVRETYTKDDIED